ncbi:MAG TPA: alpha/beta hydrolase, partial [Gemmatimonadaceae bacterium]|nr:alpha/beta hydrolase [Gemmatimonadaceae bacterium]
IGTAGVLGVSAGGPWAFAFAATHPSRVRSVGLICASGPYDDERFMSAEDIDEHRELRASGAEAMLPDYEGARARILADPATALAGWFEDFPEEERRWVSGEPASSILIAEVREALRQGARGWLRETEVRAMPWSFDVATIPAPVHALHGTDDAWELITNIERMVAAVPDGHVTRLPGGNHLAPVMRAEEVVAAIVAR